MSKHARLAGLMTLIAGLVVSGSAPAATQAATPWVQTLTQEALDSGFLSRLPPNISVVFGLAKGEEGTDVRQLLDKQGTRSGPSTSVWPTTPMSSFSTS